MIQCLSNASQHVPINLQPFSSNFLPAIRLRTDLGVFLNVFLIIIPPVSSKVRHCITFIYIFWPPWNLDTELGQCTTGTTGFFICTLAAR